MGRGNLIRELQSDTRRAALCISCSVGRGKKGFFLKLFWSPTSSQFNTVGIF